MRKIRHLEDLQPLCDGERTAQEIADILGWPKNTVKNMTHRHSLPMRAPGNRKASRLGANNPAYRGGRRIDRAGYVYVTAPLGHPHAFVRKGRQYGHIRQHRLLMEESLGRYLEPDEVVDHIDGLTLHNDPSNLRLFASNSEHLYATLKPPIHSEIGLAQRWSTVRRDEGRGRICTYSLRLKRGDVRLRQILLAALRLGIDSPHLSGTNRYMKRAGIDPACHPSLEHGLQELESRYAADLIRS